MRQPWQTVYWYFQQWEDARITEAMLTALREQARIQQGRDPQLEKAVDLVLDALTKTPPRQFQRPAYPNYQVPVPDR